MTLPSLDSDGLWLGRVERAGIGHSVVTLRNGRVVDITSKTATTVRDILEREDAADYVRNAQGDDIGPSGADHQGLAPCDLQAVKACGVTFAGSMVERVIIDSPDADVFQSAAQTGLSSVADQTMLTDEIAATYRDGVSRVAAGTGVSKSMSTSCATRGAAHYLFAVSGDDWLADHKLQEEVFGPLGIIVRVKDTSQMQQFAHHRGATDLHTSSVRRRQTRRSGAASAAETQGETSAGQQLPDRRRSLRQHGSRRPLPCFNQLWRDICRNSVDPPFLAAGLLSGHPNRLAARKTVRHQ